MIEGILIGLIGSCIPLGVIYLLYMQVMEYVALQFPALSGSLVFRSPKYTIPLFLYVWVWARASDFWEALQRCVSICASDEGKRNVEKNKAQSCRLSGCGIGPDSSSLCCRTGGDTRRALSRSRKLSVRQKRKRKSFSRAFPILKRW